MGAEVVLAGDSYAEAQAHCDALVAETGLAFVHPFDDPLVIAGQGTIGEEILRQSPRPARRRVRAGRRRRPHRRHRRLRQGADAGGEGDRRRALRGRRDVPLARGGRARAPRARRHLRRRRRRARGGRADLPRSRARRVDEVVRVTNDEICAAIKDVFDDTRSVMEPAGRARRGRAQGAGSARERRARPAAGRGPERRQHELRPAALRRRARRGRRGARGAPRRHDPRAARRLPRVLRRDRPARRHRVQLPAERAARPAHIFVGVATASREDAVGAGRARCARAATRRVDLTDNEMAKLHVRHMVGGRAAGRARRAALPLRVPRAARAR